MITKIVAFDESGKATEITTKIELAELKVIVSGKIISGKCVKTPAEIIREACPEFYEVAARMGMDKVLVKGVRHLSKISGDPLAKVAKTIAEGASNDPIGTAILLRLANNNAE